MRHPNTLPRRAAAFLLAFLLAMPVIYADAGDRKLQTSTPIVDGLTYHNTVTVNGGSRVESFSLELDSGIVRRIGLYNVQKVVSLLYGPEYGLSIESAPGAGTRVTLTMPWEMEE